MFKKLIAGTLLASIALVAIIPVASADAEGKGQIKSNKNAVDRIVGYSGNNNDRLDTLIAAVTCDYFDGAVVELLATAEPITIFAPTNYAFRKAGRVLDEALELGLGPDGLTPENVCLVDEVTGIDGALFSILGYHVFPDAKIWYKQAKAATGAELEMLSGETAIVGGSGGTVTIAGAEVVVKNIRSANAITHVTSDVLVPPSVIELLTD